MSKNSARLVRPCLHKVRKRKVKEFLQKARSMVSIDANLKQLQLPRVITLKLLRQLKLSMRRRRRRVRMKSTTLASLIRLSRG